MKGGNQMERTDYILLKELGQEQNRRPGVFPVFKKILRVDGEFIGEVQGYSDEYGNRYEKDLISKKSLH